MDKKIMQSSNFMKLALAATFTSEPIEESLYFWSKKLDWRLQIQFAPYNQVFQELLNPSSLLSTNQDGINIILLRLEDWQNNQNTLIATVEGSEKEAILDSFPCHRLPNNIEIAHLNRYETEYLYQEIFIDKAYLKHGINLNDDACVIDIGANIGLFTLFVQHHCYQAKIYSFEPAIHAFERLQANAKLYCKDATVFNCGLGNQNQEETFTFYPNSSVFSSFDADTKQDEKALRAIILNMLRRYNSLDEVALNQVADEFLAGRLEQQTYKAQLRTLSSIIDDYNIEQIDLLKLDAEKSELSILEGIEAQHWSRIQQIVMEVHDQGGNTLGCVTQLLKDKGFEFVVEEETLLEGSGLYNIYATRPGQQSSPPRTLSKNETQMEQNVRELGEALKTAVERSTTPHLVCLCPTPNRNDAELSFYRRLEQQLISELKGISSLHWLTASELAKTYPVADYAAPDGNGHIPYTRTFFAALGTGIVRKLQAIISNPYKVIVLDCDHTLWKGVCGEDGATGVEIDQSRQALQSFIVSQQQAGKLICLCSKNNEEDVFAVFNHHDQMPLQRHHLVSWRINWQAKSQNLKALAAELNLGLDSFIFIDDNPVECMEVRANCPQVLTLQLPPEDDHIPSFLQHIWAFDQLQVTQADQQRTKLYQQNVQRQRFQEKSLTFKDFLAGLQLDVDISPMKPQQLPRVAQLTQRTNQFNLTTIRRSEAEIQQLCNAKGLEARVVQVKDRFGDYGLVGLLLFETQSDAIASDSFLLSCRVLGRGVEHQMLAQLGKIAQQRGLNWVEVNYQLTAKNQPALDFLESVAASFKQEKAGKIRFKLPTAVATTITFNSHQIPSKPVATESIKTTNHNPQNIVPNITFEEIANTLYNPEQIIKQIQANFSRPRPQIETPFIAPSTALEQWLSKLFAEVLNINQVGVEDNFLELGGDSIRGAILINQLQNKLNEIIQFVVLLEQKTVAKLTAYLEQHYPQALTKLLGENASVKTAIKPVLRQKINGEHIADFQNRVRAKLQRGKNYPTGHTEKNPQAIFILSPYRSGSTLLRVILGGHPQLFAPPELELLAFDTLQQRKAAFSERYRFWLEGTVRALMQIKGCGASEAMGIMENLEASGTTTQQFYHLLQNKILQNQSDGILVDKTPSYALDIETLERAERDFENPLYIHLQRHPYGVIRSCEEIKLEQVFFVEDHPFSGRELAEVVWQLAHQNILAFLQQITPARQYQIKFEDLVRQPQSSVENLCQFLGLEFHPEMLELYTDKQQRMTDGVTDASRMVGDVKFHQHQGINPEVAESWQQDYVFDFLGEQTWQLANSLGYSSPTKAIPLLQEIQGQTSFPLSFPQQRLWFLVQLEPNSPFYNMFEAVTLEGQLNVTVLERSLNEIIRRHEVLRTTFTTVNGVPRQVIAPKLTLKLSVIDLQNVTEQSAIVEQKVREEQLQAFDLEQSPLLRATLLKLGSQSHILLLAMHHIIADGWSLGVLIEELSKLYPALLTDSPSTLPELPIQYADFTIWQRQWLKGDRFEQQLNYWKQQLADAPPFLELPTDRPRPPVQTFRGRSISFELNSDLTAKLKTLSQQSGATLFMTLLAALTTLLYRYSGQEDVLVGTPIANRNHQELEPLIGFFVNTLVMRTRLESNPTFTELLTQVRQVALSAYANQDVPFEQLVDELQIERSLSHSPLFQVMFALQNAPMKPLSMPGLTIAPFPVENLRAKFDLTLMLWEVETPQGISLQGFWQYNSDLFDSDRITRMVGHFQTLLGGIVSDPEQRIGELPLLTGAERHQLLVEWNDTKGPYPDDQCIHQLFEVQVDKTPNAIAVVYEAQTLTYQELNERANQLAHYLQSLGVTTETLVGICIERSLDMIVGLLGILKAGCAYVPLDPAYPSERKAFMLEDSNVTVLLTQSTLVDGLPNSLLQVICLDRDWSVISQHPQQNPGSDVSSNNLVYIIYTSGSTGIPKGVAIEHRGLLNLIAWHQRAFSVTSVDRATQLAGPAFDASAWEVWPYLTVGASLYIVDEETRLWPEKLRDWLVANAITIAFIPTPLLETMLGLDWSGALALRTILTGGDKLHHYPTPSIPFELVNNYGPTENTVVTTSGVVPVREQNNHPHIGRPIDNCCVYILDRHLQPLPIGVWGELYVGGSSLARGYWNRPDLTLERFIHHPLIHAGRLYKTGDLVRYLPEGNIEFANRFDTQVKIRGFRIELSEIEVVITQHPLVRDVVVLLREDRPGVKYLAAYVVPKQDYPKPEDLQQFIKEKLPSYMVPASFTILEAFPITPNGKVDRKALPLPALESNSASSEPRTANEAILVKIWQDVLGLRQVGIYDNFFALGGESIIAMQIITRANQAGLKLTPKQLFGHQTIAELAAIAVTTTVTQAEQGVVTGAVPLTPIQHWFFEQDSPEPHHFNQAVLLEVPAEIQPEFLKQAVQQVFLHHDALRLQYVQQDGEWQQRHGDIDATVPFQVVDLSNHAATEQQKAIADHGNAEQRAIDLCRGVLMRVMLFPLGNHNPGRLLVVIHHLAVDGVSWRILLEDLSMAYQQLEHRKAIALPPKTTSFKEWAIRLQEYAQDSQLYSELDYWLRPAAPIVSLPVDYPVVAGANTVASRATVSRTLTVEQTRALLQDVPSAYNTQINDVLLTALVQSFAQWTGSSVFWVHLEGHGREDLFTSTNLSRTVGWFTSLFPVLLNLTGIDHPGEALKFIKEQLRQIPQRGIGYGILRYLSCDGEVPKKLRSLRVPEVSFNYLGQFDPTQLAAGWQYTQEYSGDLHSPLGQRSHLLNVNGLVAEGRLKLEWNYSQNIHQKRTIEDLANAYMTALDGLITHCLSPEADGYTPSDFPELNMNQAELDEIISEL
ncbi:non-ribosomal peptide synthetase [Moorena sp. SIO4G3]|uniref:non-ribosomal peptide synthetase n=1 Tax=Moorena sp. SIO4G3 TaxID=2607821 RepID=UPI001429D4AC|nr:non-ribosomal peptide synthetase [Moorena sp. SIO4G3]NEO76293.1 amino acid adenylation domain-containing protein [Moorena sp. SIO4G3]